MERMNARMHEPQSNAGVMLYDDDYYSDCADYVSFCASHFCPACVDAYAGKCDTTCQFASAPEEFHGVAPGAKMMVYGAWGKGVEWSALYLVFDTSFCCLSPNLQILKSPNQIRRRRRPAGVVFPARRRPRRRSVPPRL
jgi:hypothetical protein